ncbi:uncharacterized protein LOC126894768 [Daktulosphaira vitifoliae]|uniref:uncharacterized protein LOC126894768 n=1 Tax=Daktulosphaira vitifoliae TaxID=58002 RepID=UPI0021AAA031|nr:uncharacterized protein LOC126894768 [Daktulosphaira vitifoliae]XP_050521972.1 uncharacterized protein LOC126894768 [Daktulosphaira vitifoliae]
MTYISNSSTKSYTNSTASQCCILSIPNDPHLDTLKELSSEDYDFVEERSNLKKSYLFQEENDTHDLKENIIGEIKSEQDKQITLVEEFGDYDLQFCSSMPIESSLEVDISSTLDWSKSVLEDTKLISQDGIINGHHGTQVDNRPKFYTLENMPQLKLTNNYNYYMRVLYSRKDYFYMTKVVDEHIIRSMENKMTKYYRQTDVQNCNYKPRKNELCATKYGVGRWYRGICSFVENNVNGEQIYVIHLLDWGESFTVKACDLRRLEMCFMKHPPLAVKCTILGI